VRDAEAMMRGECIGDSRGISGKIRFVPVPPELVANIGSPVFFPGTIPAGIYDGQPVDVPTAPITNLRVIREAITDYPAYLMPKSPFNQLYLLVQPHLTAKDIDVAKAPFGSPIPLHLVAARYYREIGLVK
jgi:TRAP-type uncharacterized transport system substrate-binding protein